MTHLNAFRVFAGSGCVLTVVIKSIQAMESQWLKLMERFVLNPLVNKVNQFFRIATLH